MAGATLKGRGVREAEPPAGAAPAPRRSGGGGGYRQDPTQAFLRDLTFYRDPDTGKDYREYTERNTAVGTSRAFLEARLAELKEQDPAAAAQAEAAVSSQRLEGLPGTTRPYMPHLRPGTDLEGAAEKISRSGVRVTPEQLQAAAVATYGGTPEQAMGRLLQEAGENYQISEPHIQGIVHGVQRAVGNVGQQLVAEQPDPRLWSALGIEEAMLRKRYGAEASLPEWLPRMKDLPPVQTGLAYGALAAGAGAAGLVLANHLIAQGAQQQSPVDYAAAVQAMNAYA